MADTPQFSLAPPTEPVRIAKAMARAGIASRRECERIIESGAVMVNGDTITSPALNITPDDTVTVYGTPLPKPENLRVFLYHKPSGLVTSNTAQETEHGTPDTIYQHLPPTLPRLVSVGRLDIASEGLLLLTNDGDFARYLELPQTGIKRTYRVRVRGRVDARALEKLNRGVTIQGVRYGEIMVTIENQQGSNAWLNITLTEGKNREIRRVMEHLGYPVNRLIRQSYGLFKLGDLPRGDISEVAPSELRKLLNIPHKGAKAKPKKTKPRTSKKHKSQSAFAKKSPAKKFQKNHRDKS